MRSGISTDSSADDATFAVVTGAEDPDYPIGNLADEWEPAIVARVTPDTGEVVFTFVLPAARAVQLLALVEHNIPDAGTVRVELFSDPGVSVPVVGGDTGAVTIPDRTGDRQTFAVLLDAALNVRSGRVTVNGLADDLEIGAFPIASFWEFPWIGAGLQAGLRVTDDDLPLVGGGAAGGDGDTPRTRRFEVPYLDLDASVTTRLDAQKRDGLTRPFVYVEDYDTASSLPRDCFLATHTDLAMGVAQPVERDTVSFEIEEHHR